MSRQGHERSYESLVASPIVFSKLLLASYFEQTKFELQTASKRKTKQWNHVKSETWFNIIVKVDLFCPDTPELAAERVREQHCYESTYK